MCLGSTEAAKAERLTQIRKEREELYAQNYQRKQREQYNRKCKEAHRQLNIGNPILRGAIKRDMEAAKTEKGEQFQAALQQMREFEGMQMQKEDKRTWRQF